MEGRLWTIVLSFLPPAATTLGRLTYDTRTILMIGLWAMLHDRPDCWGCQPENWPDAWRPPQLPDPSTLSRRWRKETLQKEAEAVYARSVAYLTEEPRMVAIGGRPLPVPQHTKDPEARYGRGIGGLAKGYKLHAAVTVGSVIVALEVESLSAAETKVAKKVLRHLPASVTRVVGDKNYDSMPLRRVARRQGCRLYMPLRNDRVGRRQQPERLRMQRLLKREVGQRLLQWRDIADRCFGQMSNFGCGYKGLPNWCRRRHRVRRWLLGKVVIYHAFLLDTRRAA